MSSNELNSLNLGRPAVAYCPPIAMLWGLAKVIGGRAARSGGVPVMLWWCPRQVVMVSLVSRSGGVPVMLWWCPGHVVMECHSCCGAAPVMLWWCAGQVVMGCHSCCDGAPVMLWWCARHALLVCRSCRGGVPVRLWWYPWCSVLMVFWRCFDGVSQN